MRPRRAGRLPIGLGTMVADQGISVGSRQPYPVTSRVAAGQINHDRVSQLVQALVFWVARDLT